MFSGHPSSVIHDDDDDDDDEARIWTNGNLLLILHLEAFFSEI